MNFISVSSVSLYPLVKYAAWKIRGIACKEEGLDNVYVYVERDFG
jgi:hypothetical protein